MPKCDMCGSTILFGGHKKNGRLYCRESCYENGTVSELVDRVPVDVLKEEVQEVHKGHCPKCGEQGPVDVHTSYHVWSILVMTFWKSKPQVCCRWCGVKAKLGGALVSGIVGWWGFPAGLIMTPIQVGRNLIGIMFGPNPNVPTSELETMVRLDLVRQYMDASERPELPK